MSMGNLPVETIFQNFLPQNNFRTSGPYAYKHEKIFFKQNKHSMKEYLNNQKIIVWIGFNYLENLTNLKTKQKLLKLKQFELHMNLFLV